MRRLIILLGAVIAVIGLVLSLVPLVNGPSQVLTPAHSVAVFNATAALSLTTDLTIGISWNSNEYVSLLLVACRSFSPNSSSVPAGCSGAALTVLNGTSGSRMVSVPLGGTLLVGIASPAAPGLRVNVQLRPVEATIGAILVIAGASTAVVGWLLPRRAVPPAAV